MQSGPIRSAIPISVTWTEWSPGTKSGKAVVYWNRNSKNPSVILPTPTVVMDRARRTWRANLDTRLAGPSALTRDPTRGPVPAGARVLRRCWPVFSRAWEATGGEYAEPPAASGTSRGLEGRFGSASGTSLRLFYFATKRACAVWTALTGGGV